MNIILIINKLLLYLYRLLTMKNIKKNPIDYIANRYNCIEWVSLCS